MTDFLDTRKTYRRPISRFLVFGLIVVLAMSVLSVRLVQLQVVSASTFGTLAEGNRTDSQAIASSRGLIYDRDGRTLVTNIPTYSVKIRPVDLPESRRDEVVTRLASLLSIDPAQVNAAIDANPGSRFDLVRVAQDVAQPTANLIAEAGFDLPGVEVAVEARRQYTDGPLMSQILGYTGPVNAEQLDRLKAEGYLPDDLIGKAGVESFYEEQLRGTYGVETIEKDARGRKLQVLETVQEARDGDSLRLTISTREQQLALKALQWGMKEAGLKRGVVIVMNPQTGEVLALVSMPTYDNNSFATGISTAAFQALASDKNLPLLNHAVAAHYPPGSTYKLVTATGGLADGKIRASTRLKTQPFLQLGDTKFYEWNRRGWGLCDLDCGFGHSSDTYHYRVAGMLGIDRLGYWANQYGFGTKTGIDLPGEVTGIVPTNDWKLQTLGAPIFGGETYQAGIGQGYDVVTPIQLINAYAALANGGHLYQPQIVREIVGPDGEVVRPFAPKLIHDLDVKPSVLKEMREAARSTVTIRHTYNLVDLPLVIAGKSGTAEFGVRDSKGRLPFHSWFVGFVPKDPTPRSGDRQGLKALAKGDSELVVLAFAYDSRTKGNVATEIVKYYMQLHFGVKKDYRNFDLLERGNFYQSN